MFCGSYSFTFIREMGLNRALQHQRGNRALDEPRPSASLNISTPEVTVSATGAISFRNGLPVLTTAGLRAVSKRKSDNLASAPAQYRPQPTLVVALRCE